MVVTASTQLSLMLTPSSSIYGGVGKDIIDINAFTKGIIAGGKDGDDIDVNAGGDKELADTSIYGGQVMTPSTSALLKKLSSVVTRATTKSPLTLLLSTLSSVVRATTPSRLMPLRQCQSMVVSVMTN